MRACMTASGGVMFIPDEVERATAKEQAAMPVSYNELVSEEAAANAPVKKPLTQKIAELLGKKAA